MEMRMTYGRRFLYALAGIFLLNISVANAAVVIDFSTGLLGPGGTISSSGGNVTGTDILIGGLLVQGAPVNDGTYQVDALLNFDTAADTITIVGSIADFGISSGTTLLSGSFSGWTYGSCGLQCEFLSGEGPDTKSSLLLDAIGLNPSTPFEFFGFTIEAANGDVVSTDIVNTAVPVPAAVWLFGSGLLGLVGIARRKAA